jgi:broad specificity phosphatase PhoE
MRLWLARHGETEENVAGRILGRRDPPLSSAGLAQAAALAGRLRDEGVLAVWTSPLQRARRTAAVVAQALGLDAETIEGLVESDRGDWEGRLVAELALESPDLHAAFLAGEPSFRFPGGESLAEQRVRTRSALEVVTAGPLPALVVAHAGTIRAALADSGEPVPAESALPHGAVVELALPPPG